MPVSSPHAVDRPVPRSPFNVPLQSRQAPFAGLAVGAGVGSAFSLAFEGVQNLPWSLAGGTGVGALLGLGCTWFLVAMDNAEMLRRTHAARVQALGHYPGVVALLQQMGTTLDDTHAVNALAQQVDGDIAVVQARFDAYCADRDIAPNPLVNRLIRDFYLTHCAECGMCLFNKRGAASCFLVAMQRSLQEPLVTAINDEGHAPSIAFRNAGCAFLELDLAMDRLRDASDFTTEVHDGEWQPQAVHPVAVPPFSSGSTVTLVRRRRTRRSPPAPAHTPDPSPVVAGRIEVRWGVTLREQLADEPPESRLRADVTRIKQSLCAGGSPGHAVVVNGFPYYAEDVHPDGLRGRNVWRLLYRRKCTGYELVGIANYHDGRLRWWRGIRVQAGGD